MPENTMTGREAFENLRESIEAMENLPTRRPSVDVAAMVEALIEQVGLLREDKATILMPFEPGLGREVEALIDGGLETMARALLHIDAQDEVVSLRNELEVALTEALALREVGSKAMILMASLGLIPKAREVKVRRGRGRRDLVGDLEIISHDGLTHWAILEPLQQHQSDESKRMTRPKLERMAALAVTLTRHLDATGTDTDWRKLLIAAFEMLGVAWDKTRACARCAYHLDGQHERAEALHSLYGLSRG